MVADKWVDAKISTKEKPAHVICTGLTFFKNDVSLLLLLDLDGTGGGLQFRLFGKEDLQDAILIFCLDPIGIY